MRIDWEDAIRLDGKDYWFHADFKNEDGCITVTDYKIFDEDGKEIQFDKPEVAQIMEELIQFKLHVYGEK